MFKVVNRCECAKQQQQPHRRSVYILYTVYNKRTKKCYAQIKCKMDKMFLSAIKTHSLSKAYWIETAHKNHSTLHTGPEF